MKISSMNMGGGDREHNLPVRVSPVPDDSAVLAVPAQPRDVYTASSGDEPPTYAVDAAAPIDDLIGPSHASTRVLPSASPQVDELLEEAADIAACMEAGELDAHPKPVALPMVLFMFWARGEAD